MKTLIDYYSSYLDSKKNLWSASTLRSEKHRLVSLLASRDINSLLDVQNVWAELVAQEFGAYSKVTAWTRLTSFYEYLISLGLVPVVNPFDKFRKDNGQLFRNAYTKRTPKLSFEDAVTRIDRIPNPDVREKCKQILRNGLRYAESNTLTDGIVTGKGQKVRDTYSDESSVDCQVSYSTLLRALKKVGINGLHTLRKIRASHLVTKGANSFELKQFMGWSDIKTAESYVSVDEEKLKKLAKI